jgi:hypothetical protein
LVPPAGYRTAALGTGAAGPPPAKGAEDVSWVALALAVAAVAVAARWYAHRVDRLGWRRDLPLVGVVLLAVLAVGAATPGVLRARQERRLAAVASALAGMPVAVRCQALGGARPRRSSSPSTS